MTTDDEVETIRAALDFRHVPGFARSRADRDIATLLGIIDELQRSLATMDHFADVAERTERRSNELHAEIDRLRAASGPLRLSQVDRATGRPATVYTPPEDALVVRSEP